jgi:NADH-quinone oxidoreductase subunit N
MLPDINLLTAELSRHLLSFLPELLLCFGIVLLLFMKLFRGMRRSHMGNLALLMTVLALGVSVLQWMAVGQERGASPSNPVASVIGGFKAFEETNDRNGIKAEELFRSQHADAAGLLVYDRLTIALKLFLLVFTALIIWLTMLTGIPDREDSADFHTLLLGGTLGMILMASANHLLMIWIAIEMASLPSYALAGFLKGRRQSSEAALKYVVYGGGAAGVMLYGISLLAGKFGTAYVPDLARGYIAAMSAGPTDPVLILGTLFILIGIAFKLAAVPFHFWCPDVFEGASAEVAGYLSVASKGAALALLARLAMTFGGLEPLARGLDAKQVLRFLVPALAFFAALTATFGNLAAYMQTNLKRLLAYSTIAHAGYMMMALAAMTADGVAAMLYYLIAYLFMNLGAFAVVAFLRNQTGSEDLSDFRGLVRRSPWMVITLCVFLLSLLGIPPLVGFFAKYQIFAVLWDSSQSYYAQGEQGNGAILFGLLLIGGVNTVLSAMYYIKVMKVMIVQGRVEDLEGREPTPLPEPAGPRFFAGLTAMAVLVLGIAVSPVVSQSDRVATRYKPEKAEAVQEKSPPLPRPVGPKGRGAGEE